MEKTIDKEMMNFAHIYAHNSREIVAAVDALAKQAAKHFGKASEFEMLSILATCSSIKHICTMVNILCFRMEGFKPLQTSDEFREFRMKLAEWTMEKARYYAA